MVTKDKIEQILREKINVYSISVIDESPKHKDHAQSLKSGGGHFDLVIVSDDFEPLKLIERHRLIYGILNDKFQNGIHALSVKTLTVKELSALES